MTVSDDDPDVAPANAPSVAGKHALIAWLLVAVAVTGFVQITAELPGIGNVGSALVATTFLMVPMLLARWRNEDLFDYGFTTEPIGRGLRVAGLSMLVIFPLFVFFYFAFYEIACQSHLLRDLVPHGMCRGYLGASGVHFPKLTGAFAEFVAVQLVVVALPEELFFRGCLLRLLEERFPPRRRILGGGVGLALVISSVAFALVHLPKEGDPRALATFFPALLFGWMRSATGSIFASTLTHASSNILVRLLDLSVLR